MITHFYLAKKNIVIKTLSILVFLATSPQGYADPIKRSVLIKDSNPSLKFEEALVSERSYYVGDLFGKLNYEKIASVSPKAYWIMTTEVTYNLYQSIYDWAIQHSYQLTDGCNGWKEYSCLEETTNSLQHPVTLISWMDAIVWANALSERLGLQPVYKTNTGKIIKSVESSKIDIVVSNTNGFRLPTLIEWHIAARGGNPALLQDTYGTLHSGSNSQNLVAWDEESSQLQGTTTVKQLNPNELGLYDMSGNVSEWIYDSYISEEQLIAGVFNKMHYFCGESWKNSKGLNLAYCNIHSRHYRLDDIGFRLVRN
ncbi:formylglycine-generating enzyme family protein [Spartinivicinus ruber]|uniref:formylglycine-generating enzyme family protein n=1 Tax=Spartinivicinus ruber TaxID=2683272 RepID=UPI0022A673BC|nr:SUMF1/EgtB/PvdO family nonheme iron enzyme [Spartinivicinus ruber]